MQSTLNQLLTFIPLAFWISYSAADGHGEADSNAYVLHSEYEIATGQDPATLSAELVEYQKNQEAYGFNNCGVYQHQFGTQRGFYTFCYFNDFDQLDAILKKSASSAAGPQSFADHSDNILEVQQRNLTISPEYIAYMRWDFDASLTLAERQQRADKLFDMFNTGFGGCNLYHHAWGGEMAHYMACGYTDYSDFGKKFNAVNTVLAERFMDAKLDIRTHSDELLIRVME